jgi:hypothetical protein
LKNSRSTVRKLIASILDSDSDLSNICVHFGDLLIVGSNESNSFKSTLVVKQFKEKYNLNLDFLKYIEYNLEELKIDKWVIINHRIKTNDRKLTSINQLQVPSKNSDESKLFMNFFANFNLLLPNFADLSNMLNEFNNRQRVDRELIIMQLKSAISKITISGDLDKPFVLCTGFSEQGFSAVLGQVDSMGQNQIVSFRYEKLNRIHEKIFKKIKLGNKLDIQKYLFLCSVLWALEEFRLELKFGNLRCKVLTKFNDFNSVNKIQNKFVIHKLIQLDDYNFEFIYDTDSWYFSVANSLKSLIDTYNF